MPRTPLASAAAAAVGASAAIAVVFVGVLVDVSTGVLVMAGLALVGAVTRLVLPAERSFAVRRRYVDVTVLAVFAAGLAFLALTTPLD